MKNYMSDRPLGKILNIPAGESNSLLFTMVQILGEDWIEQDKGHLLQKLWRRKDFLATTELLNLAYSINNINKINPKWLQGQIKKVKSDDINNVKGALFEIIGFGYLMNPSYKIELASDGNPGIDGTIVFNCI